MRNPTVKKLCIYVTPYPKFTVKSQRYSLTKREIAYVILLEMYTDDKFVCEERKLFWDVAR